MITGINGTTGIVENTIILLLIDKIGRIWPITIGAFGMAGCMLTNAILNKKFPANATNPNSNALRASDASRGYTLLRSSLPRSELSGPHWLLLPTG
jgi:hypothetical protein